MVLFSLQALPFSLPVIYAISDICSLMLPMFCFFRYGVFFLLRDARLRLMPYLFFFFHVTITLPSRAFAAVITCHCLFSAAQDADTATPCRHAIAAAPRCAPLLMSGEKVSPRHALP